MIVSQFSKILRQGAKSSKGLAFRSPIRMYSGGKNQSWIQKHALNVIGLPVCAFALFVILPTFTPGEIHSIDWYDEQYVKQTKAKEAAKAAAAAV